MSIADKLTRIAENEQKVYDAGKVVGESLGYEKGHESGYQEGHNVGQTEGIEQGKQAEYDRFWDAYQESGQRDAYDYAFYGSYWTDALYTPKYPIKGRIQNAFRAPSLTNTKVPIVATGNASNAFYSSGVVTIPSLDITAVTNTTQMFASCGKLQNITISGTIKKSVSFANSNKLTDVSVQSVIDHLDDLTGAATQTLTFHATVGDNMTDAQKAAVTAKNWTLAY